MKGELHPLLRVDRIDARNETNLYLPAYSSNQPNKNALTRCSVV